MIKKALRNVDEDAKVTPTVDTKGAEPSGRAYGDKFSRGFQRSRASKLGAWVGALGGGFKVATAGSIGLIRNIGTIAAVTQVASRSAKMLSLSLLGAAGGMKVLAGMGVGKLAAGLGIAAHQAHRLSQAVGRVTSALLVLMAVGKVLGVMNKFAKITAMLTIGGTALLGVMAALATTIGQALVSALTVAGAAAGVFAGAAVGLLGPAIGVLKLGFKGLEEGAKAFGESMKDSWGPADEAFNKMIGERMGPLLTKFRELRMAVVDTFSNALVPAFASSTGTHGRTTAAVHAAGDDDGQAGSEVAGALASPANAAALDKMFAASDTFFSKFLGESGLSGAIGGLVQFAATAADTFKGVGAGINEQLLKFGEWLRGISPAQMIAAFAALKAVVSNIWAVLKPI